MAGTLRNVRELSRIAEPLRAQSCGMNVTTVDASRPEPLGSFSVLVMAGTRVLAQRKREPLSHVASRGSTAERHSPDIATVVRSRLVTSRDRCGVSNRA